MTIASGVALHGRHLNEVSASNVSEFTTAIADSAINKILLAAGTYELTTDMCTGAAVCINRTLIIEAEVPGAVVFNAMGGERRVFEIQSGGTVELIGLNITGGYAYYDGSYEDDGSEGYNDDGKGGGVAVWPNAVANFEGCNIHDNNADYGGGVAVWSNAVANFEGCNIYDNTADLVFFAS